MLGAASPAAQRSSFLNLGPPPTQPGGVAFVLGATDCTRTPSSPPSTNFSTPNGQPRSQVIEYSKTMLFPITGFCHEYIRHLGMDFLVFVRRRFFGNAGASRDDSRGGFPTGTVTTTCASRREGCGKLGGAAASCNCPPIQVRQLSTWMAPPDCTGGSSLVKYSGPRRARYLREAAKVLSDCKSVGFGWYGQTCTMPTDHGFLTFSTLRFPRLGRG